MIEVKNVSKKYKEKVALSGCNIQIPRGQIIGLFGSNGAGKTTLMKCIMGFLTFEGEITLGRKEDRPEQYIQAVLCYRRPLLLPVYYCRRS